MSDYSDLTYFSVTVAGGVASVLLDGPYPGNKITPTGHTECGTIWSRLAADDEVEAVVFAGADDTFCDGVAPEMGEIMQTGGIAYRTQLVNEVHQLVTGAIEFPKPTVVAINGTPASGTALTLALLSDVVIAEAGVRLSDTHVPHGVAAGDGSALTWVFGLGLVKAKRYLLTGEPLDAEAAERMGLVSEVVGVGASRARATDYATRFAAGPRDAVRLTKQALNEWMRQARPIFDRSLRAEAETLGLPNWSPS